MQIVIPMSGRGQRFLDAGYRTIKPLVEVDGRPMIEHVVATFPGETDFVFICARDHLETTPLRQILSRLVPGAPIVVVEPNKLGPVWATMQAQETIKDDAPVMVNYCDFAVKWDYDHFLQEMQRRNPAGCITAYRGFHPHSLGPNLYAYMRHHDNYLLEIREKYAFTSERMGEYASSGAYYFRDGKLCKHYFREAMERDLSTKGEFYASMPYNLLLEDGLPVYIYELEQFLQWGTPEDLEEYVNWSSYFAEASAWSPVSPPDQTVTVLTLANPRLGLPVAGVPAILRACRSLPPAKCWRAVGPNSVIHDAGVLASLRADYPSLEAVSADDHSASPVQLALHGTLGVDGAHPLLVSPADAILVHDESAHRALVNDTSIDAIIWTFQNLPHANRYPEQYAWVDACADGRVRRILRDCTSTGKETPGITGAFWFRRADQFAATAKTLLKTDPGIGFDAVVNRLLEQGARVQVFNVRHCLPLRTADDTNTFEYWERYFRATKRHPYGK